MSDSCNKRGRVRLDNKNVFLATSRSWHSKIKVLADLVLSEALFSSCRLAVFLLCLHMGYMPLHTYANSFLLFLGSGHLIISCLLPGFLTVTTRHLVAQGTGGCLTAFLGCIRCVPYVTYIHGTGHVISNHNNM